MIARDLGPLPEIVAEGGGLVFRDQAELMRRLEDVYRDADLRERLGRQGRRAFLERWTPEPHLERYFALIE